MREDLFRGDSFHLEIDGVSAAGFVRCAGLESSFDVLTYAEGGATKPRWFRGAESPGRILLERGLCRDRSLWDWYRSGDARRGAILLLDGGGRERARWSFRSGFPCRWQGPHLDARRAEVALELVEIVHEGIEWQAS